MRNLLLVISVLWMGLYAELGASADRRLSSSSEAPSSASANTLPAATATLRAVDSSQIDGDLPVPLAGHLSWWLDRRDNTAPAQVLRGDLAPQFAPLYSRNVAHDNRASWFRFDIDNRRGGDREVMLVFDNMLFFSIDIYYPHRQSPNRQAPLQQSPHRQFPYQQPPYQQSSQQQSSYQQSHQQPHQQQWQRQQAGLLIPWRSRAQDYRYYAFPLQLEAGAIIPVYIQVKSIADTFFAPYLISERGLVDVASSSAGRANLMIGIVIGIAAYMLLLSVAARDWSSATWYCLAAMFVSISILAFMNGELGPLLARSPYWHTYASQVTTNLEVLLLLQFTRHAFQTWRHDIWLDRGLRLLCYIEIGLLLPSPWLRADFATPIVAMATVSVNYLIALALYFAWQRRPSADYYLLGMLSFTIFNALFVLGHKDLITPTALVLHGYELSFCFQSAAFAMMLTDKLRRIRRERSIAEAKANIAEAESRAKSDFLAVMSHEIRTPLNGVLGMTELLGATALSKAQRYYVKTIYNSGKTLLRVLSDILDYSKVEAGKMELERAPFNVSEWLTTSIAPYRFNNAAQHLNFSATITPDMPQWLLGDTVRLQQVLTNLLDNAFKFTQHGDVAVRVEPGRFAPGRVELCCSVRDSGPGIAADLQERLFRSFAQADASSTRRFGGTGLGLAICNRLVTLMGGNIEVDSQLGAGSTFRFSVWLPTTTALAAAANVLDYSTSNVAARL